MNLHTVAPPFYRLRWELHRLRRELAASVAVLALITIGGARPADAQGVTFTKDVAPILVNHCGNCHVRGRKGDFQMQSFDQLMSSGQLTAGSSSGSHLMQLVSSGEMPPRGQVPAAQIETLRKWVEAGAKFDGPNSGAMLTSIAKPAAGRGPVNRGDAEGYVGQGTGGGYSGAADDGYNPEDDGYNPEEDSMDDDGYDDTGYGDTGYGGGGGRNARGAGGNPLLSMFREQFFPVEPATLFAISQPDDVPTGPVLSRESEQAFTAGNLPVALQLYFGHIVAEYEQAAEAINAVRYSRALLRPVWHSRWGVSMMVRGDSSDDEYKPIEVGFATGRTKDALRNARGRRGALASRSRGGGGGGGGDIIDYSDDDYGGDDIDYGSEGEVDYGPVAGAPRRGQQEQPAVEIRTLDEATRARFKQVLGLVATKVDQEFVIRYRDGLFGMALKDADDYSPPPPPTGARGFGGRPMGGLPPGAVGARQAALEPTPYSQKRMADLARYAPADLSMWTPGIVVLGEGSSQEITKVAQEQGIDLLLHFDVILKPGPDETVQNLSRCRVVHVASGKAVGVSKAFDSAEAERLVDFERTTEEEYVADQLQNLLDIIDEKLAVSDMPPLTPEVAKRRVGALIGNPGTPPLRTLAEIRMYQARGLLDEADVESAFEIIAGDDGLVLLHGPLEQRLAVVRRMATGGNN